MLWEQVVLLAGGFAVRTDTVLRMVRAELATSALALNLHGGQVLGMAATEVSRCFGRDATDT